MKYGDFTTRNLKTDMMSIVPWPWLRITGDPTNGESTNMYLEYWDSMQPFLEFRGRECSTESRGDGAIEVLDREYNRNQFDGKGETEPRPAT